VVKQESLAHKWITFKGVFSAKTEDAFCVKAGEDWDTALNFLRFGGEMCLERD